MPVTTVRRRATVTFAAVAIIVVPIVAAAQLGGGAAAAAGRRVAAVHKSSAECPAAFPLRKVHAGQRATGLTTVKGTTPTRFSVRVLGVMHNGIAPGIDMIVISAHSRAIRRNGTWEGMSGSPIYARDGRLLGALSYGISFGATDTAGVTPAAAMYQMLTDHNAAATTTAFARHVALPDRMRATVVANGGATPAQSARGLALLPTPITVTGLPANRLSALRRRLQEANAAPFSLHVGGAVGVQRTGSAAAIRPGAPFAATTTYGDYTLGGVGTTTAVCNGKVLAFGHPMMDSGATTETANTAHVLFVQRDPTGPSFIMANLGPAVGTVNQDRSPGLRAVLGIRPAATAITTHVIAPATGLRRTGRTHTPVLTEVADATAGATYGNLLSTAQSEGPGSAQLSWTASGHLADGTAWRFHRTNLLTDPFDIEFATADQLFGTLTTIVGNSFDVVSVDRVAVHVQSTESIREWELRGLLVRRAGGWREVTPSTVVNVTPGSVLHMWATLQAYQDAGKVRKVRLTVTVPASAGVGSGQVQVSGGADLAAQGPDTSNVTSFAGLLHALAVVPHNDALVTELSVSNAAETSTINRTQGQQLARVTRGTIVLQLNVEP